jgi:diguanylate cyclase (GGDEF)-like protein
LQRPAAGLASILVVEDEPGVRRLVGEALGRAGHRVREAGDLSYARALLAAQPVDLVLADITLGAGGSGIELLDELAPRAPELAVVMMTGTTDPQTAINCLRQGAFDYLLKPFSNGELLALVDRVLSRQRTLVAERRQAEEQLRVLGRFPSDNPNPVLRVAADGRLLYANAASRELLAELRCQPGEPVPAFLASFVTAACTQGERREIEVAAAGRVFSIAATPVEAADYVYLYGHDITRLKEAEQELVRLKDQAQAMALHDPLTGLPNRTLLEDRFQQAIAQSERRRRKLAVVFIDLDNFKQVNDTHGHRLGDQVLVSVAQRLHAAVRKTDTVARWGGDEMILLLPELRDRREALLVCERLKRAVQDDMAREQPGSAVTMSMGIAIYPDDAELPDLLLQQADTALYLAKSRGRDGAVLFSDATELQGFRQRADLRLRLGRTVAEHRIQVHYQPIVMAATGRVCGVEALARWHDATLGWVAPETFIPFAEADGWIHELGRQVLEQSLRQLSAWQQDGLSPTLSVNVSARQLARREFLPELVKLAASLGLRRGRVILELTESQSLLGLAAAGTHLEELAQAGFPISLDDFGRGYSSLSSLHEMPVHELKFDLGLVRALASEKGRQIGQAVVDMARALGVQTAAEGVETAAEAAALKTLGVDRLQGFYFAHPRPAADTAQLLRPDVTLPLPVG